MKIIQTSIFFKSSNTKEPLQKRAIAHFLSILVVIQSFVLCRDMLTVLEIKLPVSRLGCVMKQARIHSALKIVPNIVTIIIASY